jgi:hypothetical protein
MLRYKAEEIALKLNTEFPTSNRWLINSENVQGFATEDESASINSACILSKGYI